MPAFSIRALLRTLWLAACLAAPMLAAAQAGVVVDRVAARIENDIITLSDIRELAAYQRLAGREPAADSELLRDLINQWIVANDAAAARFPRPPKRRWTPNSPRFATRSARPKNSPPASAN